MLSSVADRWIGATARTLQLKLHLPLRTGIRNSEIGRIAAAAVIGAVVAPGVAFTYEIAVALQRFGFGAAPDMTGAPSLEPWRLLLVPSVGGLLYGLVAALGRWRRRRGIVDAVEANALYGGQMSVIDSLRLAGLSILSAGVGAAIGLEAACVQLGSAFASRLGRSFRLRRSDLRVFVGCGAAAAIAAAFDAPLAGAFYAFELILGGYTLASLAPVTVAALAAALVERHLFVAQPIVAAYRHVDLIPRDYLLLAAIGVGAAGLAIAAMMGVAVVEGWLRRLAVRRWLRPAAGGVLLGATACLSPQILGSGHGGILGITAPGIALPALALLILGKLVASAVSIGSGFRGGMFSSALVLGALFGTAVGVSAGYAFPWVPPSEVFTLAGMAAVAAAVVGAPATMILLVLEATADFSATIGAATAVLVASIVIRHVFGYSFATWRFHARGAILRGARDERRLHDLTAGRLMRREVQAVAQETTIADLRRRFPIGSAMRVFLTDEHGGYAGFVQIDEAHGTDLDARADALPAAALARCQSHFLLPRYSVRTSLDLFLAAQTETLVVVNDVLDRQILGYVTEGYAQRHYSSELESRRHEELGDDELFSPPLRAANSG